MEWYKQVDSEFNCSHDHAAPVKYTRSNGVISVRIQCPRCGESQGERKKAEYHLDGLGVWDESIRERWRTRRRERYEEVREAHLEEVRQDLEQKNAEWWRAYNAYLRTPQWHKMRSKVLDRDANLCQACLTNKATHVHHLSYKLYDQLGKSAAFELVAICRSCHEQIHPHMSEAQDGLSLYNPYLNGVTNGQHR